MKKHYRHENNCLNCGTILEGKYCHNCGQENLEIKESFGHMMNHAISDYFHFDHQFFHTLKPLLFKPGFLTNEYMAGRRVQYLHPVKMYIFISLVYFLLLFQTKSDVVQITPSPTTTEELTKAIKAVEQNSFIPPKAKQEAIKNLYDDAGYTLKNGRWVKDTSKKARQKVEESKHYVDPTTSDTTYEQYLLNQRKLAEPQRDGWFKSNWNKKAFAINKQKINMKDAIIDGFKHNFPKVMFVLLPLFALILMVAFYKNKKFYVEHLIYAFHLHCFLFLFLTIVMLVNLLIPTSWIAVKGWFVFSVFIAIIWYVYASLRVVYHRSWWRTIFKLIGIYFMYFLSFILCISLLVLITIFTAA
ncbi:DUF3667 domain-containing protein [uncultured Mucilaginibacter sp.]|uniref:DUF3667 domain-containing protein n=1 Tax=uncultured Mucilaginibacter sp. TaxID=797541 RepID=UPI0025D8B708|nr:DUF3667 domain-containing protein [uncultured Mucilaginibacter sp.]